MKSASSKYQISAIIMALLMFFTSVGVTADMHYCQGKLKTFSFFGKAKSCHDIGAGMKDCPHHKKLKEAGSSDSPTISKKDCCSHKTFYTQFDEDQQNPANNVIVISSQLQHFVIAFVEAFLKPTFTEINKPKYAHYKPPLISRDIPVLFEAFLL